MLGIHLQTLMEKMWLFSFKIIIFQEPGSQRPLDMSHLHIWNTDAWSWKAQEKPTALVEWALKWKGRNLFLKAVGTWNKLSYPSRSLEEDERQWFVLWGYSGPDSGQDQTDERSKYEWFPGIRPSSSCKEGLPCTMIHFAGGGFPCSEWGRNKQNRDRDIL